MPFQQITNIDKQKTSKQHVESTNLKNFRFMLFKYPDIFLIIVLIRSARSTAVRTDT